MAMIMMLDIEQVLRLTAAPLQACTYAHVPQSLYERAGMAFLRSVPIAHTQDAVCLHYLLQACNGMCKCQSTLAYYDGHKTCTDARSSDICICKLA